jgi:hypothetical protein
MRFTIHEKQVKAKFGADYDLAKYTEGVDYKRQKTGFGSRVMFKAGLFDLSSDLNAKTFAKSDHNGSSDAQVSLSDVIPQQEPDHVGIIALSVVDPSLVEHKQDKPPILIKVADLNLPESPVMTRPALLDGNVRTTKVVRKHQNQRYVETDTLGRVFVGSKGNQIKLNQVIQVKDGSLYLG